MSPVVKKLLPRTWRTEEMHTRYEVERADSVDNATCPLCDAPVVSQFTHWKVVKNRYPYDAVAHVHDMLVTNRHIASDAELTKDELDEFLLLKKTVLNESYTFVLEALPRNKSVPGHHHLHLIVPKTIT